MHQCKVLLLLVAIAITPIYAQPPTISGVSAFWHLGHVPSGASANSGTCSGQSGACCYTQTLLTADPHGATGSIFPVSTDFGCGTVTSGCTSG
jgi:hypothetical protein